jgi:hypothetical protein
MIMFLVLLVMRRSKPELMLKILVKMVLQNILQPPLILLHYRRTAQNTRQIP